jgi:hypothetical protein
MTQQTTPDLSTQVDITTGGEYADHDEIKIVMTREQGLALAAGDIEFGREFAELLREALR